MKQKKPTTKLFSLSCEREPGVLSRILTTLSRPGHEVYSLSQSHTDLEDIMLITLEVLIPGVAVDPMLRRLERIIGVIDVTISFGAVMQSALFRLSYPGDRLAIWDILNRHNARAINLLADGTLLVHQVGAEQDILKLYNELDGPALKSFSRLPLAISQPLSFADSDYAVDRALASETR